MIILIFGKSGTGKTYLSKKLNDILNNSIHIDLDQLNADLMNMENVINFAIDLFGKDVLIGNKLNKIEILSQISSDNFKYLKWYKYMFINCEEFLKNFISKTTYSYYIIDHMNAGKLNIGENNVVKIKCHEDDNIRKERLIARDNVSEDTINFRDQKYEESIGDLVYTNNIEEILNYLQSK